MFSLLTDDEKDKVSSLLSSKQDLEYYNCHGLTLSFLDIVNEPFWADESDLMDLLEKSIQVNKHELSVSDFMVIESRLGHLDHSAIYLGNDLWLHKKGKTNIEIVPLSHVLYTYLDSDSKIIFYRMETFE